MLAVTGFFRNFAFLSSVSPIWILTGWDEVSASAAT